MENDHFQNPRVNKMTNTDNLEKDGYCNNLEMQLL